MLWASEFAIQTERSGGGILEAITLLLLYLLFGYALGVVPALISALLLVWRRRASVLEAVMITIATTVALSILTRWRPDYSLLEIAGDTGKTGIFILPGVICAGLAAHWWGAFEDNPQTKGRPV